MVEKSCAKYINEQNITGIEVVLSRNDIYIQAIHNTMLHTYALLSVKYVSSSSSSSPESTIADATPLVASETILL